MPIGDGRSACARCGAPGPSPQFVGLRTGGHSGGAGFLFGQLAEIGETVIAVAIYTCNRCGHMDFFRA